MELETRPRDALFSTLDAGEAAVIQLALEKTISSVCLDERKGRRIAISSGLSVIGSLGLIGRAKTLGLISKMRPLIDKARREGVYYDSDLVDQFLKRFEE